MKILSRASLLILGLFLFTLSLGEVKASTPKIALGSVGMIDDTFDYTGDEIHPEFTVYDVNGDVVAPENYTCEYIGAVNSSNENTKLYIVANEDSGYKGSLKKQFFINPVSIKNATVSKLADMPYTGSYQKPLPVLTYNGKALTAGTDYILTYENNLNAGTATVTVTGRATASETKTNKNFTDAISLTFKITPLPISDYNFSAIADRTYTGSAITPGVSLMMGDKKLSSSQYRLTYKNNINAGTATVTATGNGNYSGSICANFKIVPKNNTPRIYLSEASFVYDGTVKKPKVTKVTVGTPEKKLDPSQYTVRYSSGCKNADSYQVTVTLRNNYAGKNSRNFVIAPQSMSKAKVELAKRTYTYSGKAFKPDVTVTLNGTTLKKGTDYKVIYSSNKLPGTGNVIIEGIGNYKGKSASRQFVIRKDIQKFKVTPKAKAFSLSFAKLKKAAQSLPVSKTLKISNSVGAITYDLGYSSAGYFTVDRSTGKILVAKGTPKGTYDLTLRLCAAGNDERMICYRLADIRITVK